ncbi:ubiquitin-conjugating enzyme e2-17 kda [Quercus suber]|uniref:Ubiquitin-conjugating enzyme e2-17 kDa n=1 Tax=Quercus suber TaxID=58331 RepID=A0AAW0LIK0_QUESU
MDSCLWSNLPGELTDRVFRRNNINSKDLARCSLVCTTWRLVIADIWGKNFSLLRTANTRATRRIVWDYKNFQIETFKGCKAELVDSLFHWEAIMIGPKDTPYADGVFLLKIYLSHDHPFQPPEVKFLTKKSWCPSRTIFQLLLVIYARFSNPEPDDPIDCEIAQMYKTQRIQYDENARDWTKKYATASRESAIDWSRFLKNNKILEPTKLVD